mmetsp:Transcript_18698/g.56549  ORF Transcript_18698/g.56549 Transcript_18698/m.56549 type:complete len:234 (-) Transcript_18698:570-1271(-)
MSMKAHTAAISVSRSSILVTCGSAKEKRSVRGSLLAESSVVNSRYLKYLRTLSNACCENTCSIMGSVITSYSSEECSASTTSRSLGHRCSRSRATSMVCVKAARSDPSSLSHSFANLESPTKSTMGGMAPSDMATSTSSASGRGLTWYMAMLSRSCRLRKLSVAFRWLQNRRPVAYSLNSLLLTRSITGALGSFSMPSCEKLRSSTRPSWQNALAHASAMRLLACRPRYTFNA